MRMKRSLIGQRATLLVRTTAMWGSNGRVPAVPLEAFRKATQWRWHYMQRSLFRARPCEHLHQAVGKDPFH